MKKYIENYGEDSKNIPTYISLADTLEQTPRVLAEQADEINN